jgi:transposase
MSAPVLGIDIAKQRIEVALLVDGKVKNKSFKNTTEGFEALKTGNSEGSGLSGSDRQLWGRFRHLSP